MPFLMRAIGMVPGSQNSVVFFEFGQNNVGNISKTIKIGLTVIDSRLRTSSGQLVITKNYVFVLSFFFLTV